MKKKVMKRLSLDKIVKISVAKYRPLKIAKLSCRKNFLQGIYLNNT